MAVNKTSQTIMQGEILKLILSILCYCWVKSVDTFMDTLFKDFE